jgi:trans-2,3-dihydro-3-hydroxyanthranilate isomerase
MRYRIVDVFTDRPFSGNALCVVIDPCPEPRMAAVAREVNLSETTFPVITGAGAYSMRVFTPAYEIPFAGHPSLGTAWVLGPGRWRQTTPGATVAVEATADGAVMSQPDPVITEVDPDGVEVALGLPGIEGAFLSVAGGTAHVLVPTAHPLDDLGPELRSVARVAARAGGISLCPFRRLDDRTLHVRVFVPGAGVSEDRPARPPAVGHRRRRRHPAGGRDRASVSHRRARGGGRDPGRWTSDRLCRGQLRRVTGVAVVVAGASLS